MTDACTDALMPFPENDINPELPRATVGMWEWVEDFGLCPSQQSRIQLEQTQPDLWMALSYPTLDAKSLVAFSQFCAWALILDDQFDDGPVGRSASRCLAAVTDLATAVQGGASTANPLTRSFSELWPRLTVNGSPLWRRILREDIVTWLWTYYAETCDRCSGRLPTVAAYQQHRRDAGGAPMFLDLCEVAVDADLPVGVRHLPSFAELRHACAEYVGLYNDVRSYSKEVALAYGHNAVNLLMSEGAVSVSEARDVAIRMVCGCSERIVASLSQLPAQLNSASTDDRIERKALAAANAYVAMVRGNFDWHRIVPRYTDQNAVKAEGISHLQDLVCLLSEAEGLCR